MSTHDHLPFGNEPDENDWLDRQTPDETSGERPVLRPVPDRAPAPGDEVDRTDNDLRAAGEEDHAAAAGPDAAAPEEQADATRPAGPDAGEEEDGEEDRSPAAQPVDPPAGRQRRDLPTRARSEEKRAPVLAPWLRDWQELRFLAGWLTGYVWHKFRYHGARIPLYLLKLAGYSPRGVARTVGRVTGWLSDGEAAPLRREAVDRRAFDEYMHLAKLRRDRLAFRGMLAAPAAAIIVFLLVAALTAGVLATVAVALAAVVTLGLIGAPADKPVFGRAVASYKAPRLTSEVIERALGGLGIAQINQALGPKGQGIAFPKPIVRDGPGWRAEIDLPYGVTADDIIEKRKELASGLRRPRGCVWPEPGSEEHEGRLVLWVGDQPFNKSDPAPWPLLKSGQVDLFQPFTFGADQRHRGVRVLLMFAGILIGAMPRMGKTFALRVVLLACALDPRAQLRLFELKGTGDLKPLAKVAHHYASGADDETVQACMTSAREVYQEMQTRAKRISDQPLDLVPESKVTPQVANQRSLGLFPIVFAVDECQEVFSHPDYKDEADRIFTAIVRRGPAMGIIPVLATQRPDAKSLPTGVSANVGIRFCLKVMGQTENDMVLGTSRYKEGVRATMFALQDKGIGYLIGGEDNPEPQLVRSAGIDNTTAEPIVERAYKLRARAGTLSGHAIGEQTTPEAPTVSLLDDLIAVTGVDEDTLWSEIACQRLEELRPDTYHGWTAKQLADALRPYGITTKQVWGTDPATGEQRNRRGIVRAHLLTARNNAKEGRADD